MKVRLRYFAVLRDQRGVDDETIETLSTSPATLYEELRIRHGFSLPVKNVRAAVNGAFVDNESALKDGDEVVFIPPVAGG